MSINIKEFKDILHSLGDGFENERERLVELDSVVGDGDLGITMSKIFKAASEEANAFDDEGSIGNLLIKSGMAMAKAAPSTMGTLMATAFMEAGKLLKDSHEMGQKEWKLFFQGLDAGILKRGKAAVGDKTVFDVIHPVKEFVLSRDFMDEKQLFAELVPYSAQCLEKTKDMVAQHGKAACFGEKTKGHVDAGATVADLMVKIIGKYYT